MRARPSQQLIGSHCPSHESIDPSFLVKSRVIGHVLTINVVEQGACSTLLISMRLLSFEIETMSLHVTSCRCGRGSCEDVILVRVMHGISMTYRTEPHEAVVAVSYQGLSMFPDPAFLRLLRVQFLRGRCGCVATEVRASDKQATLILPPALREWST